MRNETHNQIIEDCEEGEKKQTRNKQANKKILFCHGTIPKSSRCGASFFTLLVFMHKSYHTI